mgnify:CR=1 FL=1
MKDYPSIAWLLLALTCLFTYLGLNPRTRRNLRWGRTKTSYPMSTVGVIVSIATFVALTAAAFGFLPFFTIFLSIPALLIGALYDSWRNKRDKEGKGKK